MNNESDLINKEVVYVQAPAKKSGWRTFWLTLAIFLFVCGMCGLLPIVLLLSSDSSGKITEKGVDGLTYTYVLGKKESDNKILAIYIDQPILTSSQDYADDVITSLLVGQYVFGYKIKDQLMEAVSDSSIKGIVFFINSPGGTVVGSRAIAEGVSYYREQTKKPVYAYVEDMAASGAYWVASATDKIYAEQGSLTGSIGVLMGPFEYYDKLVTIGGVSAENGISISYITGGKYKDLGNPTKRITEEELAVLQKGIDSEYSVFVDYVAKQRKISTATIRDEVRALIYGAEEAKRLGLIDVIGSREDAVSAIAGAAGVSSDYKLVKIGTHTSLFGGLFASLQRKTEQTATAPTRVCVLCGKYLSLFGNPLDY